MSALTLRLLGGFDVRRDGVPITHFRGLQVQALLAYLAVEADRPHPRAQLAALLWPDQPIALALRNLTQTAVRLHAALGAGSTPLVRDRESLAWQANAAQTDVDAFRLLVGERALDALAQAAELYHGELLAGFSLPGCVAFEEWLLLAREELRQRALAVLLALAEGQFAAGDYVTAAATARRHLAIDPWREEAHRQVMRALAAAGERVAALAAYDRCRQVLHDDLGLDPDPATHALAEQIQQEAAAQPPDAAPAILAPRAEHPEAETSSLPAQLTTLVGREEELAQIHALLGGSARLVTVIGAGGAGKTRLALAAAWTLRHAFPDGAWWAALVGLEPAHDPALQRTTLAGALAAAAGIAPGRRDSSLAELAGALRPRQALLVLDNCEHLPELAPVAQALLTAAPGLRVLATSRAPLALTGETLLRLDGLPVPADDSADLARAPGVQLFLERAARHAPAWALDASELAGVARLCRLLGGLPLGIELAARWAGHYTPDEIVAAVQHDLDFLADRAGDRPDRHRSLRAVFQYTWRLLEAETRAGLARLAVFRGSFDRAAARGGAGIDVATLAALVDASLLRQAESGRYELHALLRQFAAERLEASGEAEEARARHAAYYLALAEQAAPELSGPGQAGALERLDRALDNLRAALGWVAEAGQIALGLRLAGALERFWFTRGYLDEGREWLARFLAAPRAAEVAPAVRAQAYAAAGLLANTQGDHGEAVRLLELGLGCYEEAGDLLGAVRALTTLGGVAYDQGDLGEAVGRWTQSLAQARAMSDPGEVVRALGNLGEAYYHLGELARAEALHVEALALARELGRANLVAFQLGDLGNVARRKGELAQAKALHREALELKRGLGARRQIAISLEDLACVAAAEGDGRRAARLLGAAAQIRAEIGTPQAIPEREATRQAVAAARAALGEEAWAAAFNAGLTMSVDQAIIEALAYSIEQNV